eukprot:comp8807_c0_seq1/m.4026 comp8807_c0_seq1/g.4026  ORF comp8807_c0_seq1/g.4026 comp8807_c0_seq1/m.4026 type:complete len:433 (-) comp8807_c0_seq1:746-2044(-)
MSLEVLAWPGADMMSAANDYMDSVREAAGTATSFAIISLSGVSHALEALLHVFCLPLKYISPSWHNFTRIWLLRLGWSPIMAGMWLADRRVVVTGDQMVAGNHKGDSLLPEVKGKNKNLVLINHQAYADTFFVAYHMHALNSGDGTMMWAIWKTFLFIPLGWASYMAGHIFLGHGAKQDEKNLHKALDYFVEDDFRSFCVYPEGGVFRKELLQKSLDFARKEGLPELQHHLLPRFGAFLAAVKKLREAGAEDLFDVSMGFPASTPWSRDPWNLIDLARPSPMPMDVHLHIRKYKLAEVGETEEEQKAWLLKRWVEREALMVEFKKTQRFPGEQRDGSPGIVRVWADVLLWTPFVLAFMYAIGLAGIRFSSVAMTFFYMFWVSGASATISLPSIWGLWIGGFAVALFTALLGPISIFSVSMPSLLANRRRTAA